VEAAAPQTLADEVAGFELWYHTLELAPGVITPGWLDCRPAVEHVPFPASLESKRCLDVGTYDGFWAFEMEKRGAAEVIGIDVLDGNQWDWPAGADPKDVAFLNERKARGRGFEIAKRELGSSVERLELSVYDLDPEVHGRFDLVYLGSLLVHLRDPVRALERVRSVCDGSLLVMDGIDPLLSVLFPRQPVSRLDGLGSPWWWYGNAAALGRLVESAGFDLDSRPRRVYIPPGPGRQTVSFKPKLLLSAKGREELTVAWKGDPHAVLSARPKPGLRPPP
jgi:tRNA (mo5U34)-methyltransferase